MGPCPLRKEKCEGMTSPPERRASHGVRSAETVSKLFGLTGTRVWTSSPIQYTCPTLARWTPASTRCNTKPGVAILRSERLLLRETPRPGEVRNDRQNSTVELKSINLSLHPRALKILSLFISIFVFLDVAPAASSRKVFQVLLIVGWIAACVAVLYVVLFMIWVHTRVYSLILHWKLWKFFFCGL